MPQKVLVLDAHVIQAVTIVRGLADYGLEVTVASCKKDAVSFYCNRVKEKKHYPDPTEYKQQFIEWCIAECMKEKYALIIPTTDATGIPLSEQYERIAAITRCATVPYERLLPVYDKVRSIEVAKKVNVPIPRSVQVGTVQDIHASDVRSWHYPVVLKPIKSLVSKGLNDFEKMTVAYAATYEELIEKSSVLCARCPVVVQEYVRGDGVGVEVLCKDGNVLCAFQHRRIHELPLTGGGSTYRKSEKCDSRLYRYSSDIMKAIGWTGVAMVEFKHDRKTGACAFMEINGRFWGSLPLSYKAGINFPALLYRLIVENNVGKEISYKEEIYCRNEQGDISWFKENLSHQHDPSPLVKWMPLRDACKDMMSIFSPKHHFDLLSWSDIGLSLKVIVDILRGESTRAFQKLRKLICRRVTT